MHGEHTLACTGLNGKGDTRPTKSEIIVSKARNMATDYLLDVVHFRFWVYASRLPTQLAIDDLVVPNRLPVNTVGGQVDHSCASRPKVVHCDRNSGGDKLPAKCVWCDCCVYSIGAA